MSCAHADTCAAVHKASRRRRVRGQRPRSKAALPGQWIPQRFHQALRQHQHPAFAALAVLAVTQDQRLVREVNVLHPQLPGLADSHAGAVRQPGQQRMLALHPRQDNRHFIPAEHHRQSAPHARALQLCHPRQAQLQHLGVQENKRRQRLLVRRTGQLTLIGRQGQKRLDLGGSQVSWMSQPMKADECLAPVPIRLLGAPAVMQIANALAQLVKNLDGAKCR